MRATLRDGRGDSAAVTRQAAEWLQSHPEIQSIATFAALRGEVDLSPLVPQFASRAWLFPRVVGDAMVFSAVTDPQSQLGVGAFGILEPHPELPMFPIERIDGFLCPGLAFDLAGGRLGRGRGFYDRALKHARPEAVKLGVGFSFQVVPNTYPEPHDIFMNQLITEQGCLR